MDAPFGTYPTKDGWVTIAMSPYSTLVGVLKNDNLLQYDDPETLFANRDEIWRALAAETGKWNTAALITALLDADIWCGEVKSHLEAAEDPQVKHLGLITSYEHPTAGKVKIVGPSIGMSRTPPSVERSAPLVGQHTREILAEYGYSADEISAMIESGAAATTEDKRKKPLV